MRNLQRLTALLLILCLCIASVSASGITEESTGMGIVSVDTKEIASPDEEAVLDMTEEPAMEQEVHAHTEAADTTPDRMTWKLDSSGTLWIGGKGIVKAISSAEEQPWRAVREQIKEVRFESSCRLMIEDIAYWFADCTNLVCAELSGSVFAVGTDAFRNCAALEEILVYTREGAPDIASDAFYAASGVPAYVYVQNSTAQAAFQNANWYGRSVDVIDISAYPLSTLDGPCGISGCACTDCTWYYEYEQYDETYHWRFAACTNCSATEELYASRMSHTFNASGTCTGCGYKETTTSCTHGSTYNEWSGCTYYTYCNYCGALLGSGTDHGTYTYGPWTYYTDAKHRRMRTCSVCGESDYQYADHSTTTKYAYVNTIQHNESQYCATCQSSIGSATKVSHTFTYGSWKSYSAYQHNRSKDCKLCNYGTMEYYLHSDNTGDGLCDDCGYVMSVTVTWDAATNGGTVNGAASVTTTAATGKAATAPEYVPVKTGHAFLDWYTANGALYSSVTITAAQTFYAKYTADTYTVTFDPGEGTTEIATKEVTYGEPYGELPIPVLGGYQFDGWFTETEGGTQIMVETEVDITADQTLYAHWTRVVSFSVTVPASLPVIVDENGKVHTAAASIINNSTGDVQVSAVSLSAMNGWTIEPYTMNAARQKVDANRIGFSIRDAQTVSTGEQEDLSLPNAWQIAEGGALDLAYDAIVTALSQPVSDLDVLSVIFILDWA